MHRVNSGFSTVTARAVLTLALALMATGWMAPAQASSHREAPLITEMPKVDGTDFYMFSSYETGRSDYVTLIANYLPLQDPYGGPNYFALDPGAQYEILMLASRADGLSVGEVAQRLHRSGAFITIEANRLVQRGILAKGSDPADGRRVRLGVTAKGRALIARMAPHQRRINDVLFECLDGRRFAQLRALAAELVACGDRAVAMLEWRNA